MRVTFIGTGGSWPSPERSVSALVVKIGRDAVLFDCGEGAQRQLMLSSVSFMKIDSIFITHFHGDHILGLPGLMQSMSLNNREDALDIYGPEGTVEMVENMLNIGVFSPGYPIMAHELKDGDIVEFEKYTVKCANAQHSVPALAYSIQEADRIGKFNVEKALSLGLVRGHQFNRLQRGETVTTKDGAEVKPEDVLGPSRLGRKMTYSGDSAPCKAVIDLAQDSDLLIHEATADTSLEKKANEYGHSTARQAAEVAVKSNSRMLVLTHISARYDDPAILEEEAKAVFENTKVAFDLMEVEVKLS